MTVMDSIQDMIDVNTIIGEAIETSNNVVIIPISKVAFGFAAGGSEFNGETVNEYTKKDHEEAIQYRLPFGGGSGAGVNISPVAFLVIQDKNIKLLPVNHASSVDKLLENIPDLLDKLNNLAHKVMNNVQTQNDEKAKNKGSKNFEDSSEIFTEEQGKDSNNERDIELEYDVEGLKEKIDNNNFIG